MKPKSPIPKRAFHIGTTAEWLDPSPAGNSKDSLYEDDDSFYNYDSRSSTPEDVAVDLSETTWDEKSQVNIAVQSSQENKVDVVEGGVGRLPHEVYDKTLGWWRGALRRRIVKNVEWETEILAAMQNRIRTPFLDSFFVYTSSLGTHTFFMTVLPAFFFFGYEQAGRGLLFVLAFGVYASSFAKDLLCSPRPFAPPVTRLTIGTHHLEYGFPSTHSTNSVSIALFFFSQIYYLYTTPVTQSSTFIPPQNSSTLIENLQEPEMMISSFTFYTAVAVLLFYTFSIVFGRLYTAMHSFTDCFFGVTLGTAIWALHVFYGSYFDSWVHNSGWIVPTLAIPICLLMVHRHPQPVDDCPCFEDAIAFVSVVLGETIAHWFIARNDLEAKFYNGVMPGHPAGTLQEMWAWWSIAAAKMVIGVLAIFAWRIFAKFLCHRILPPTFRLLAQVFTLPHRRFYTPATDYKNVPQEKGLSAIPSVIDLPGMVEMEVDGVGATTGHNKKHPLSNGVKNVKRRGAVGPKLPISSKEVEALSMEEELGGREVETVKHYDADVLTKVFVYCGIGIIASGVMPIVFELLGWGINAV
ncbi:PAP2 superfamily-domain-containing protein [Abortiporus biennis]|nr:PAP2 superfamily-domain-containing protein [Abortiporus biennis]